MATYLGLDLGTSSLKALLVGADQAVLASASVALSVDRPAFGWCEQDPATWIAAAEAALGRLAAEAPEALATCAGIGLSGQMHGATLLDASDEVLRPAILWNDTRSHAEAAELDDVEARRITGNITFPGFTAPKLAWLKANEPETFARVARVLLPKDYLRLWLTGEAASDLSDASGTGWLAVGERVWSARMLARTSLDVAAMPRLVEGTEASGALRGAVASPHGMRTGVPVAGGAGDNAASACGVGAIRPGAGFVSLGTSGVLFTAAEVCRPAPETAIHTFCHAVPGLWHTMGVTLSAAGSLEWLAGLLGVAASTLTQGLPTEAGEPQRLAFLPYLAGERTPHNDAAIRGVFAGLEADTGRQTMTRAVMEGVAFSMRDCQAASAQTGPDRLIAVGAGSRSDHWLSLLATVLGTPIERPDAGDYGAAFGAARLGLCAAEGAEPGTVLGEPMGSTRFEPRGDLTDAYDVAYRRYRALYPAVRGAMAP